MQSRTTLFSVPGGDTVQLLKTAEYLRRLGVAVEICTELEPELDGFDLVHLFNLIRPQEVYLQARNAKLRGKPVVLSTIYADFSEFDRKARLGAGRFLSNLLSTGQLEQLKILARAVKNREINKGTASVLLNGYRPLQHKIIAMTDVLLPNSASEMRRVTRDFPQCAGLRHVVVPNAVDTGVFDYTGAAGAPEFESYQGCVLCVGRIEGVKNQLNLVRAMRDLPWTLVLVGKPAPNHIGYYEQVAREAGPNVRIMGQLEHEKLAGLYRAARAHCLVSWMETTGLSSLEAAAMGCNLVITEKGDTRDYFRDHAFYCEPDSVDSIREAIVRACQSPANPELRQHVINNFTWEKTAERTLEGYRYALSC